MLQQQDVQREAARWLRKAAAAILERHSRYMNAEELWAEISSKALENLEPEPFSLRSECSLPEDAGPQEVAAACLRLLQRNRMEDGPRVLARVLRPIHTFSHFGDHWFGLVNWPAPIHLSFYDQALHQAAASKDRISLEKAAAAILSLPLPNAERTAYEQIIAELRRPRDLT